jgi:hypothetical protein
MEFHLIYVSENTENCDITQSRYGGSQLNFTADIHQLAMSDINSVMPSMSRNKGKRVYVALQPWSKYHFSKPYFHTSFWQLPT